MIQRSGGPLLITRRILLGAGAAARLALPASGAVLRAPSGPLPLVMLDPGHGGKDPGAIGITGTYEKHVALAAAKELARQLNATGRYHAELTRTRDVFIPLEQRVAIAQTKGAKLFVSMHADALTDHGVRGASVYTLSERATDAQTAALAVRENASDRFAGPGVGSARMARSVVGSLGHSLPLLTNPRREASFVVLKAADIPSVLVEMGFMSNRDDEAALRRPEHRARVATAMRRAVEAYFAVVA